MSAKREDFFYRKTVLPQNVCMDKWKPFLITPLKSSDRRLEVCASISESDKKTIIILKTLFSIKTILLTCELQFWRPRQFFSRQKSERAEDFFSMSDTFVPKAKKGFTWCLKIGKIFFFYSTKIIYFSSESFYGFGQVEGQVEVEWQE